MIGDRLVIPETVACMAEGRHVRDRVVWRDHVEALPTTVACAHRPGVRDRLSPCCTEIHGFFRAPGTVTAFPGIAYRSCGCRRDGSSKGIRVRSTGVVARRNARRCLRHLERGW